MSFLSILDKVLGTADLVAPFIYPPAAGIVSTIHTAVIKAEANYPGKGRGAEKLPAAAAGFMNNMELLSGIFAAKGYKVTVDQAKLQAALSAQVVSFNAIQDLQNNITIEKIAP